MNKPKNFDGTEAFTQESKTLQRLLQQTTSTLAGHPQNSRCGPQTLEWLPSEIISSIDSLRTLQSPINSNYTSQWKEIDGIPINLSHLLIAKA